LSSEQAVGNELPVPGASDLPKNDGRLREEPAQFHYFFDAFFGANLLPVVEIIDLRVGSIHRILLRLFGCWFVFNVEATMTLQGLLIGFTSVQTQRPAQLSLFE
jgi:hypothetical protein